MNHIRSVYEWHKEQLWLQLLVISICAVLINFFELHPLFEFAIYMISVTKIVLSLKLMNVNPGSVNDQENFSWKYYQSLPLSKKDLYHLYLTNHLFNFIPMIFWFICFHRPVADLFEVSPSNLLNWLPVMIVALFAFGLQSFTTLVVYPRIQFSKVNKRTILYQSLRDGLYYIAVLVYAFIGIGVLGKFAYRRMPELWNTLVYLQSLVWNRYVGVALFIILTIWMYHASFTIWLDDTRRTPKTNWKALRDIPVMFGVVAFLIYPVTFLTSSEDGGPALHEAVIKNKMQTVQSLLKEGADINEKNEFGFTPIMTAAYRGNLKMFDYLSQAGADQKLKTFPGKKFFYSETDLFFLSLRGGNLQIVKKLYQPERLNSLHTWYGYTPLHLAVYRCNEDVVEFLLENKPQVNAKDKDGKTPLHLASTQNCFPAVASLFEAGADPLIKDKKNKLAYEYGPSNTRSPAAYIKRKTLKRLPQK